MDLRNIVVIGTSAGGIAALQRLVHGLPADFPGTIFAVLHMARNSPGYLADILARAGKLPARSARNNEKIVPGRIYVAPPDRHLLLTEPGLVCLGCGPKENGFRPAVDPLFRSAALTYGPRAIGIVLTGGLDDGTAGLCAIKQRAGLAIVQAPDEAEVPSMPKSALRHVPVDYCLTIDEIADRLPGLVRQPAEAIEGAAPMPDKLRIEVAVAADDERHPDILQLGSPSIFTCPECHGSLLHVREASPMRFRCHTGHAFTAVSLEDKLREQVETSAWSTVRGLEEQAMLLSEMVETESLPPAEAADLRARAKQALHRASLVRDALSINEDPSEKG
jgi:two-component system chemotaxis response regulator CheB